MGTNHVIMGKTGVLEGTMVMGADVTHPGKGKYHDEGCPSMAGVVGTYDVDHAQYLASARLQTPKSEVLRPSILYSTFKANCRDFSTSNISEAWLSSGLKSTLSITTGLPPKHILFYRDGVSESQFAMVRNQEIQQIRDACQTYNITPGSCKITLVVVVKGHHSRFFPNDKNELSAGYNYTYKAWKSLVPGIAVDTDVVAPKQFNFYLQSHDSPIGTSRPGHYVVMENESGYTGKQLQEVVS